MGDNNVVASRLGGEKYYGKNDYKPLRGFKKLCIYVTCIIFSPLIAFLLLLCIIFTAAVICFAKFSNNQLATAKMLGFEPWFKAPGKRMESKPSGTDTTDLIIPKELVDGQGILHLCGGNGSFSLRKSIECTVDQLLREGPHGEKVLSDTDVNKPRYLLNGSMYVYDPQYDELWTNHAHLCHWPAFYCVSPHMPKGLNWSKISQMIDFAEAPDVFGYVYFLEVTNESFYEKDRIVRVGQSAANCPEITPANEGKVFARYGYRDAYSFGNIKTDGSEPDAYIFKGKTLQEAQVKLLHTYRIVKPVL